MCCNECSLTVVCSYQLAESVDSQLRRMEQDLKVIIEQMNSSNAAEDEDNPVRDMSLISTATPPHSVCLTPDGEGGEDPQCSCRLAQLDRSQHR